jgi:hypothetical protein
MSVDGGARGRRPRLSLARVAEAINASLRVLVVALESPSSGARSSARDASVGPQDLNDIERGLVDASAALAAARRLCNELEEQILVARAFLLPKERTIGISPDTGAQRSGGAASLPNLETAI